MLLVGQAGVSRALPEARAGRAPVGGLRALPLAVVGCV